MANNRTIAAAGLAAAGAGIAVTGSAGASNHEPIVAEDFSSWPGENALQEYAGAGALENDGGDVVDGALRLEYDEGGWFLSVVREDLSEYDALELVVRGDDGGEEADVRLEIDDVEGPLSSLSDDSIGTDFSTVTVDLTDAGVDAESVQDVWMTFWRAGSGAIEIDEIRFVAESGGCEGGIEVGDYCAQDTTGDGLHEDVNGDGTPSQRDVAAFFEHLESDAVQGNPDAFNFDEEGGVGFSDIVALFQRL